MINRQHMSADIVSERGKKQFVVFLFFSINKATILEDGYFVFLLCQLFGETNALFLTLLNRILLRILFSLHFISASIYLSIYLYI